MEEELTSNLVGRTVVVPGCLSCSVRRSPYSLLLLLVCTLGDASDNSECRRLPR